MVELLRKSFVIVKKTSIVMKNNGTINTLENILNRYKEHGRKGVTKGINNDYKALLIHDEKSLYKQWILANEKDEVINSSFTYEPLISIVMPTYNIEKKYLQKTIDSVLTQNYSNWELCIADDASTLKETIDTLKKYEKNSRVNIIYRKENGHISNASNTALSLVKGEYVTFLDHDDMLAPFALSEVVSVLNQNKNIKLIYSDEDKIDENDKRFNPHFKSDWNLDMFLSQNYISHLTVIKKEIIDKTEGFRVGYEGSQDYDIFLQAIKFIDTSEIAHISKILYHWRAIEGSTAQDSNAKEYTSKAGVKALKKYFTSSLKIDVKEGLLPNTYKITYPIYNAPLVSIIIPTKDNYELLFTCIDSIVKKSTYVNYEIIIVDNQTTEQKALDYLEELACKKNIKVLKYNKQFNYAKINNYAVDYASGEFLAFLNNDIEVLTEGWIEEMLQHALRDDIGIVGAKLHYPDMSIQHAGVVLGIGGVAGHSHKYFQEDAHGYFSRLKIIQNYSALTAACIVVKKSIFSDVYGFEEELEIAFNDIDLSLKVLEKGYRNLWTPYAKLIHHESKSRGVEDTYEKKKRFQKEKDFMLNKWEKELLSDKCYNKNLTLEHENFTLKV